jgi:hypothetical protein
MQAGKMTTLLMLDSHSSQNARPYYASQDIEDTKQNMLRKKIY